MTVATVPRSLSASESVSAGGKTASKGAFRVGRSQGLFASTAEPADLELILESGGRVRLGGYLLVPAAPPTANGLVFRCNSNGSGYWDSGSGLPVSWSSVAGKPTTLGGFGITDAVPAARLVSAGSGLTGGGALSGDISFAISVIDDTQHGTRGGGTTHAEATGYVAGFMPAAAVTKLAGIAAGANVVGAASSTDNALARFDGTTGKLLQNSSATLDDSGNLEVASVGGSSSLPLKVGASTIATATADRLNLEKPITLSRPSGTLTIASGAITVTGSAHTIDTEGGAASDDLDTINGGEDGQLLYLRTTTSARDVVLTESGNIAIGSGTTLTINDSAGIVALFYTSAASKWLIVSHTGCTLA